MAISQSDERPPNRSRRSSVGKATLKVDPNLPLVNVVWEDPEGRKWMVKVPKGHEDQAQYGIPVGPPDLSDLDLPHMIGIKLHNQLFHRGLFTAQHLRGRHKEVQAAIQGALKLDVAAVTAQYR